jgi:hypothetical protein
MTTIRGLEIGEKFKYQEEEEYGDDLHMVVWIGAETLTVMNIRTGVEVLHYYESDSNIEVLPYTTWAKPTPTKDNKDPWKHRSTGMRCASCMWFAPKGEGDLGRCRRRAPTMNGFPAVFKADWCGDHKLDEEKT